uniref:t-SNARE coiled-coil homology domain-containing protein n=1 Tax=Globodera rostochiensis TaxID=31243 RepID=A0A914HD37_GLORO
MELENKGAEAVVQKISLNIQQLSQFVQNLNQLIEKIGSAEDNDRTRNATNDLLHKSNELSHTTNQMLKKLLADSNANRAVRVQSERLMNDFMGVLNRLQASKRKAAAREKTQIRSVTMRQLQQQHRMNLDEIRERQQALTALEQDIGDINQIFKDLAHMVHDQGEMVDSIEANIEHASIHVQQAHTNVTQAVHYQTKARQKKLMISAFCFIVFLVLFLVLYLWLKH